MQAADIPGKFAVIWAALAGPSFVRTIPQNSQIGIQDGAASLQTGFPPLNFLPVEAGGVPPFGQDMNGILQQATAWAQWQAAGATVPWDGAFSAIVGGYPKGAIVASATFGNFWICAVDDNTSNPDGGGSGWLGYGVVATPTAVTGTNSTYTQAQNNKQIIRSNSTAPMADTLPGTSPGVLLTNTVIRVTNGDTSGLLSISPGAGTTIKGYLFILLGPGQSATFLSDGSNYWPVSIPDRTRLQTAVGLFINPSTGNDFNAGILSASPWQTMQHAYEALVATFDMNGHGITVNMANGAYSQIEAGGVPSGMTDSAFIDFVGASTSGVTVTGIGDGAIRANFGANFGIQTMTLQSTNDSGMIAEYGTKITVNNGVAFGACATAHVYSQGGKVQFVSPYTINAGAPAHWKNDAGTILATGVAVTLNGVLNFSEAFVVATRIARVTADAMTFLVGSGTGRKYNVSGNSLIDTNTGNGNYFPGSLAGVSSSGGQYL